jgi:hypothetical protein
VQLIRAYILRDDRRISDPDFADEDRRLFITGTNCAPVPVDVMDFGLIPHRRRREAVSKKIERRAGGSVGQPRILEQPVRDVDAEAVRATV